MEQQHNVALPSTGNANIGFATYQGVDTDNPTHSPSPAPTSKSSDRLKGNKKGRTKSRSHLATASAVNFISTLISPTSYVPSDLNGWVADPQIMTQVSNALNQIERKQQTIRKFVEEKVNGKKDKETSPTEATMP
jgi:hypothetical protein